MNHDALLKLALQAIDDVDARQVLCDAIEESDWDDALVWTTEWYDRDNVPAHGTRLWSDADVAPPNDVTDGGVEHRRDHARAVASVLLFDGWPSIWPLAERNAVAAKVSQALGQFFPGFDPDHDLDDRYVEALRLGRE